VGGEGTVGVEGEVVRAVGLARGAAASMEGRRDAELAALLPQRVVVVLAIEAELIEALNIAGEVGGSALGVRDRPAHAAAEHTDLGAQLRGDGRQFLGRPVRRRPPDPPAPGSVVYQALE